MNHTLEIGTNRHAYPDLNQKYYYKLFYPEIFTVHCKIQSTLFFQGSKKYLNIYPNCDWNLLGKVWVFWEGPQNFKKSSSYFWQERRILCGQQRTCQKVDEDLQVVFYKLYLKTTTGSSFLLQKKPSCISSGLTSECSFFSPFCFAWAFANAYFFSASNKSTF